VKVDFLAQNSVELQQSVRGCLLKSWSLPSVVDAIPGSYCEMPVLSDAVGESSDGAARVQLGPGFFDRISGLVWIERMNGNIRARGMEQGLKQ
jgi:hypothetical protein